MAEDNAELLLKLKSDLVEHEHRILRLFRLYRHEKKTWAENDPRHTALYKAMFWRAVSLISIGTCGGLLALLSLGAVFYQNHLLFSQNIQLNRQVNTNQIDHHMQILLADSRTYSIHQKRYSLKALITAHRSLPENANTPVNLTGADLKGADLSNLDLQYVDFSRATLSGADFSYSDLSRSIFHGAYLNSTDRQAIVRFDAPNVHGNTTFFYSNLQNADLRGAFFDGAIFYKADLSGVNIREANNKEYDTVFLQDNTIMSFGLFIDCTGLTKEQIDQLIQMDCFVGKEGLHSYIQRLKEHLKPEELMYFQSLLKDEVRNDN